MLELGCFCVYVFNVQPGIGIDYAIGESGKDAHMSNISGIKKVSEVLGNEKTELYEISGNLKRPFPLEQNRVYVIPGYQREIRWSAEDVQTLIDDLIRGGKKFLGTITVSTLDGMECEMIDGQQRLTVLTMIISYLNSLVSNSKRFDRLCRIQNESFAMFYIALENCFNYELLQKTNKSIFDSIVSSDILCQRFDFQVIWNSIRERIDNCYDKEKLLSAVLESDLNIVVNHVDGTESAKKFCVDYFIDINDKRKELDNLDIIRAYAFKEDFEKMTDHWVSIQNKCMSLTPYIKYSREELFYQYFVCMVNKELNNKLTKPIGENYLIKEDIVINNRRYSKGTVVWNLFSNDKFYAKLLGDLDDYLDFMELVKSMETGGADSFKKLFYEDPKAQVNSTRVVNAHTIINSILRNDDVVPKMMVMKYYLEVLKPQYAKRRAYEAIHYINIVATLFTSNGKRKGSEQIGIRLIQLDWIEPLKELAYKMLVDMSATIDCAKVCKANRKYTIESGQYMARRYLTMCDSYSWNNGNIHPDEEHFKKLNVSSGTHNMEHFIINRDFKYALYNEEGEICAEISLPRKYRKYIATIANYLIIDKDINSKLRNRPVYEKIEILEQEIKDKGIEFVIPSKRSQLHFYQIKEYLHDNCNYPKNKLDVARTIQERKLLLKNYYSKYFEEEFFNLARAMDSEEAVYEFETREKLMELGFKFDGYILEYHVDTVFSNIFADVNPKEKDITLSIEVYNPYPRTEQDDSDFEQGYNEILEIVESVFFDKFKKHPEMRSSNEYGGSDDESITFSYSFKMHENNVRKFIDGVRTANDALQT